MKLKSSLAKYSFSLSLKSRFYIVDTQESPTNKSTF